MKPNIHILTEKPGILNKRYLIANLSWHWQKAGHRITVGPVKPPDVNLGIMHFDLTRVPPECLPEKSASTRFLNERVLDISKSLFSTLIIKPGDPWDGPVIIKSNLNFFGLPELHRSGLTPDIVRQLKQANQSWQKARRLPLGFYPVLRHLKFVPEWVWEDQDLIVERFMPEREDGYFCLRGWIFFGSKGYTYRSFSKQPVIKTRNTVHYEILGEPPPELVEFRHSHGFDFGKFDYVIVDGRPILLDINKTPAVNSGDGKDSSDTPRMRMMAQGLSAFVRNV